VSDAPHGLGLDAAADALPEWGFLAEPGAPEAPGPGYLLVALRRHPTLAHFDPEEVHYWVTGAGHGERFVIDRLTPMPLEQTVSWGPIRIVDRLGEANQFLTFGGSVSADRSEGTTVAAFVSPAPLLRRGGHSQGWDLGAQALGAYFARLVAVTGTDRRFDEAATSADPLTRYAAFVADQVERERRSGLVRNADASWRWFRTEEERLERTDPSRWAAGRELLRLAQRGRTPGT
jgi:hypothetical protein